MDDVTALLMGKNKEVAEMAKKVLGKLKKLRKRGEINCRFRRRERKERAK